MECYKCESRMWIVKGPLDVPIGYKCPMCGVHLVNYEVERTVTMVKVRRSVARSERIEAAYITRHGFQPKPVVETDKTVNLAKDVGLYCECGNPISVNNRSGKCVTCYGRRDRKPRMATCKVCGGPCSHQSRSGMCITCYGASKSLDKQATN